jgi:hypothetical protein
MAKAVLNEATVNVIRTYGNVEVGGRMAFILAGAGLVDVVHATESKDRGALKKNIVRESQKFDKEQVLDGVVKFARDGKVKPAVSYLSKEANVKNIFRVPTMFENDDFRGMGYECTSEALVRLIKTEGIRSESEWIRWCQLHVASVKAAKKTRDAKKKAAAPKVEQTPAEYITKQLIRAAASAGIDPTTLYAQVGDELEAFLATEADDSKEVVNS